MAEPELEKELFAEPGGETQRAGMRSWTPPKSSYEQFMDEEEIPVYRGIIGVYDVRELDLKPWPRLGGNGAFLYLDGLEGLKGVYVMEVPGGGVTNPERHLYHEFHLVIEGRGTTETWIDGSSHRQIVEWQPGSLFYIPPNVMHRMVNATNKRVIIVSTTNAPPLYNMIRDREFIFNNDYIFRKHYSDDNEFYHYDEQLYAVPGNKRAQARTNFYPDIIRANLPLDNQRVPGYRRVQPGFRGFEHDHNGFIAQYPIGRYSRGHHHASGALLVCLQGAGYTVNWQRQYGTTPWQDGHGGKVRTQEYVQGGLVAAAPGGGNWFHQHFPVSREPFRVINYWGGPTPTRGADSLNPETGMDNNLNIENGGSAIGYSKEDPRIREVFEQRLAEVGQKSAMPPELYESD